jgi:endonuclease YncB( thermonuclease family)
MKHIVLLGLALTLLTPPAPAFGIDAVRRFTVTDGDSLLVAGERIRLHGIDAPEQAQSCTAPDGRAWACGKWATDHLRAITRGARLSCTRLDTDRYGRTLARCFVDGQDLAEQMVAAGAAVAFTKYATDYVTTERAAKRAKLGLWSGRFDRPDDWRAATRTPEVVERVSTSGCTIKGNISSSGQIYHLPGQRDYDATVIRENQGERWFCSEREAQAAGWRRARR